MNPWLLRLTGFIFMLSLILLFMSRFLSPEIPSSIREGLSLQINPVSTKPKQVPVLKQPELRLTSVEENAAPATVVPPPSNNNIVTASTQAVTTAARPPEALAQNPPKQAWIQAGSFSSLKNAQMVMAKLHSHGIKAQIETIENNGQTFHRVVFGPLKDHEGESFLNHLKTLNIEAKLTHR